MVLKQGYNKTVAE